MQSSSTAAVQADDLRFNAADGSGDGQAGEFLSRMVLAVQDVAELHIELAEAELSRDTSALMLDVAPLVWSLPVLAFGYGLTCVGSALALAPWLGAAGAFVIVGVLNLIAGAAGAAVGFARLNRRGLAVGRNATPMPDGNPEVRLAG